MVDDIRVRATGRSGELPKTQILTQQPGGSRGSRYKYVVPVQKYKIWVSVMWCAMQGLVHNEAEF